jgi:hypothetical protein
MTIGLAIFVVGIIYFLVNSPGFRRFAAVASVIAVMLGAVVVMLIYQKADRDFGKICIEMTKPEMTKPETPGADPMPPGAKPLWLRRREEEYVTKCPEWLVRHQGPSLN